MTAVIVLGMHRSGTSLVARMLDAMGVEMGNVNPEAPGLDLERLWEDIDFVAANDEILHEAGGDWANVPPLVAVVEAGQRMGRRLQLLIAQKRRAGLWGWKDPRTALTAPLWHRELDDPRYVVIRRDRADVVASLNGRNGNRHPWDFICELYQARIASFTRDLPSERVLELRYEDLTHPRAAVLAVKRLAAFLGADEQAEARALDCIEYRDRWGFGSLAVGVPYYKACYKFFRWWSWVLVGGLENGDILLNDNTYQRPMPIPMGHNTLAKRFLETGADTLCIVEDDHAGQQDTIRRLRTKAENLGFDIVCASYVNRHNDLTPVGFHFSDSVSPYGEFEMMLRPLNVAESGTQEYDGAALGCVLVRRWVLEAMRGEADIEDWFPFDWHGRNSQDVVFYHRARAVGARVGVDRDNTLIHIGEAEYRMQDFYEQRRRSLEKLKAEESNNG